MSHNLFSVSAPIQMMKKGLGEALWREKKKLALGETLPTLKGPLTSDTWLGGQILVRYTVPSVCIEVVPCSTIAFFQGHIVISSHAKIRMVEREISEAMLLEDRVIVKTVMHHFSVL